jgi:hypothetical protein
MIRSVISLLSYPLLALFGSSIILSAGEIRKIETHVVLADGGKSTSAQARFDNPTLSGSSYRMKLIKVFDREGWSEPVEAFRFLIPSAQIKGAADRAAIWRKAQQEINAIHNQAYQQQAVNDRLAQQFSQAIRGVETYVDPNTKEKVDLSAGYKQYWTNGQGEYILSNDVNFNPAVALRENWRLMDRPAK